MSTSNLYNTAAFDWQLREPERLQSSKVPEKNWPEVAKFSEERYNTIKKIPETTRTLETEFHLKEKDFLEKSLAYLQKYAQQTQERIDEEKKNLEKFEVEAKKFDPERLRCQAAVDEVKATVDVLDREMITARNTIIDQANKRIDLANKINPKELRKVKLSKTDMKQKGHGLFIWVLGVVYGEPTSKYDWNNFKKQALKADEGKDLLARLKGFNFQKNKSDPVLTRKTLEEKDAILAECEKKGPNNSLRALFDYVAMVKQVTDGYELIKVHEVKIAESRQTLEKKTSTLELVKSSIEAVEGKAKIVKKYFTSLIQIKTLLDNSILLTQDRLKVQQHYLQAIGGDSKALNNVVKAANESKENKANQVVQVQSTNINTTNTNTNTNTTTTNTNTNSNTVTLDRANTNANVGNTTTSTVKEDAKQDAKQVTSTNTNNIVGNTTQENTTPIQNKGQSSDAIVAENKNQVTSGDKRAVVHSGLPEEEEFGGDVNVGAKDGQKKEVRSHAPTDLGETPFAEKKEGGCQGCNIF